MELSEFTLFPPSGIFVLVKSGIWISDCTNSVNRRQPWDAGISSATSINTSLTAPRSGSVGRDGSAAVAVGSGRPVNISKSFNKFLLGPGSMIVRMTPLDNVSNMSPYLTAPGHFSPKIVRHWLQDFVASRRSKLKSLLSRHRQYTNVSPATKQECSAIIVKDNTFIWLRRL